MSTSKTSRDEEWIEWDEWTYTVALAEELEHAVEKLQYDLSSHLHGEFDEIGEEWEPPSGMPYCGCTTCEVREVLITVVPLVAAAYRDGRIKPKGGANAQ